jgi:hypothetical protein
MRIQKILFKILIGKNRWAKFGNIVFFNWQNLIDWISRNKKMSILVPFLHSVYIYSVRYRYFILYNVTTHNCGHYFFQANFIL